MLRISFDTRLTALSAVKKRFLMRRRTTDSNAWWDTKIGSVI
jgi:hypothetical protein